MENSLDNVILFGSLAFALIERGYFQMTTLCVWNRADVVPECDLFVEVQDSDSIWEERV